MIDYLIGVDGGGSGTRARMARTDGGELGHGASGPSGLGLGIRPAWTAIQAAIGNAFQEARVQMPSLDRMAIGLGLAGVHNPTWAQAFIDADPGYAALVLDTDAFTALMGAHGGRPGAIVAIGTGSVGEILHPDGSRRQVGGWGFPAGDEGSGAWIGLQAVSHAQHVLDGRYAGSAFANSVIECCGGDRDAMQIWLGRANQTAYAALAPLVARHSAHPIANGILRDAGREMEAMARALDPSAAFPLSFCGGLADVLRDWLPAALRQRARPPLGDSAAGALRMIGLHLDWQVS